MKKWVKYILYSVFVLLIAGVIIVPKISNKIAPDQDRPSSTQNPQFTSADGFIIKETTLGNDIKSIGTIRANEEVELKSELSRKIVGIHFKEGTFVSKGRTLFKLDASDLIAGLRKLEIDENLALIKRDREKALFEKGLIPQEEFDIQENTLEKIRADIDLTQINISKTYINAPFSGIIGLRNVSIGTYVTPAVVLATLQDVSKLKIDFSIPERYATTFQKGQKIIFKVDGVSGDFEAEVYAFEPKVESNTRTFVLRAITSNPKHVLFPGTFANVTLRLNENTKAILIPSQALIPKLKGQSVFVFKEGKAKLIDVEIGERTEESVQIISNNLNPGDTILTTNILRLRNEAPVKVINIQ